MLGVDMTTEREQDEVRILRPYDLQHQFFPAPQIQINLSVEFFKSFAGIHRAKHVPTVHPRAKRPRFSQTSQRSDNSERDREVVSFHEFAKTRECVFVAP